jgi:hypothetical protein
MLLEVWLKREDPFKCMAIRCSFGRDTAPSAG